MDSFASLALVFILGTADAQRTGDQVLHELKDLAAGASAADQR